MRGAAVPRQLHLALALGKAFFLRGRFRVKAIRTTDAFFVKRRGPLLVAHRVAARAAQLQRADLQAVADGDALIEYKAFALPQAVFWRHGFQVFQDAAFEVVDLVKPLHA